MTGGGTGSSSMNHPAVIGADGASGETGVFCWAWTGNPQVRMNEASQYRLNVAFGKSTSLSLALLRVGGNRVRGSGVVLPVESLGFVR